VSAEGGFLITSRLKGGCGQDWPPHRRFSAQQD
jgi:hypothetical protein